MKKATKDLMNFCVNQNIHKTDMSPVVLLSLLLLPACTRGIFGGRVLYNAWAAHLSVRNATHSLFSVCGNDNHFEPVE